MIDLPNGVGLGFSAIVRLIQGEKAARFVFTFKCVSVGESFITVNEDMEKSKLKIGKDQWDDMFAIGRNFQLQIEPTLEELPVSLAKAMVASKTWTGNQLNLVLSFTEVDLHDLRSWLR